MAKIDPITELSKQRTYIGFINNFLQNSIDKIPVENRTLIHFKSRLTLLEGYWKRIEDRHYILLGYENSLKEDSYFTNNEFVDLELKFIVVKTQIISEIERLEKLVANSSNNVQPHSQNT